MFEAPNLHEPTNLSNVAPPSQAKNRSRNPPPVHLSQLISYLPPPPQKKRKFGRKPSLGKPTPSMHKQKLLEDYFLAEKSTANQEPGNVVDGAVIGRHDEKTSFDGFMKADGFYFYKL